MGTTSCATTRGGSYWLVLFGLAAAGGLAAWPARWKCSALLLGWNCWALLARQMVGPAATMPLSLVPRARKCHNVLETAVLASCNSAWKPPDGWPTGTRLVTIQWFPAAGLCFTTLTRHPTGMVGSFSPSRKAFACAATASAAVQALLRKAGRRHSCSLCGGRLSHINHWDPPDRLSCAVGAHLAKVT